MGELQVLGGAGISNLAVRGGPLALPSSTVQSLLAGLAAASHRGNHGEHGAVTAGGAFGHLAARVWCVAVQRDLRAL